MKKHQGQLNLALIGAVVASLLPNICVAQGYTITTYAGGGYIPPTTGPMPAIGAEVYPSGLAVDGAGNLYTANGNVVVKVSPSGSVLVIAGTGADGYSGDGGPAINAQLSLSPLVNVPTGLAVDSAGNLYVADFSNARVRKISPNGIIATVAGGGSSFSLTLGDGGPATAATLLFPGGVAIDSTGNLYIADSLVRKVAADGTISTVAGCLLPTMACVQNIAAQSNGDGGLAVNAQVDAVAVALDSAGNLYIADYNNNRVRKVSTSGIITTVAGSGAGGYQGDGGPGIKASLYHPSGVAVDAAGNLYIDDSGNYRIRMVTTDGNITTIAGNGSAGSLGDVPGNNVSATSTSLSPTLGIALGAGGKIFVADEYFGVRLLTPAGSGGAPSIKSGGVVSATAFGGFSSVAPGSWIEIYGSNLASDSRSWAGSDFNGVNAPTKLDGTTVTIGGQSAYIDYISPTQVNAQVPSSAPTGSQPVVVSNASGASSPLTINVNSVQPGLLSPSSFNIGGKQYATALFSDGTTYVLPSGAISGVLSRPAKPGDTITLYGIGFGPVTPVILAGQIVEQSNSLASPLQIEIGGIPASVTYDGLAPNAVGLYQVNVTVPNPPSGAVALTLTLGGAPGTQTLYLAVSAQ